MPTRIMGADVVARLNDFSLVGLAQSIEYTPNFNAEDIYELGNTAKVDTALEVDLTGSIEFKDAGAIPGLLARMNPTRNPSTGAFTGYQYASGSANGKNAYTLAQSDMDEMIFDLFIHEKTDQINFNRSICLPRCFLTGLSGRADANGTGSFTMNFANDAIIGLDAPNHDARSYYATRTSGTTATIQLATLPMTNWDIVYVYVNERRFRKVNTDATYFTLTPATGVITVTTTESYVIPVDAIIRVIVYKTAAPLSAWSTVASGEQGTTARYLKGFQTSVYIAPSSVSAPVASEQWMKVQSCDWNFDFKNTVLKQIAYNSLGTSTYFRGAVYPFDITLNATVLESDWLDWKAVLDTTVKTFAGDVTNSTYDFAPVSLKNSFNVVIIQYTRAGAKVAEYRFTDMRVDGAGTKAQVGDNNQTSWSLKGTQYTVIGYNA